MGERYISVVLVVLLLFSTAAVLGAGEAPNVNVKKMDLAFSTPEITYKDNFIQLSVEGATTTTHTDGAPMLPVNKVVYEFPMGTTISSVKLVHSPAATMKLPTKIIPSPTPVPLNEEGASSATPMDENIYNSAAYYPENWFTYKVRVGLNANNERTAFLVVDIYPIRYSPMNDEIQYITDGTLEVNYKEPSTNAFSKSDYDLLIISASSYMNEMQRLADHKESHGIRTKLVSVDDISGTGRDKQEQIKYYIKNAIENWNIKYVLLVGGYRSFFGLDKPELQLPLRYSHLNDGGEDGFPSDLYYSDIYYYDPSSGYAFDDWDSNGNGRFAEWDWYGYDDLDLVPDVHLGRLACRTVKEAKIMVDKIINYESTYSVNADWFKKIVSFTGDDFQDQSMLDITWNVNSVPDGQYTIHAQTTNCDNVKGPVHEVHVTVDHAATSSVTFSETDHLITGRHYPAAPVACITVPSEGDVLGNTDVSDPSPAAAYDGDRWTPIQYEGGIMHIMGKAYDPQPQAYNHPNGPYTTIEVWITNSGGQTVFGPVDVDSELWFEGEWETEKALDYMPNDFEKVRMWTSNGMFHGSASDPVDGIECVLNQLNDGAGFVYFAGHANPMTWADHYPGIPGGRHNSDVAGLYQLNFHMTKPYLPLNTLSNGDKLPVVALSGCHPSAIDCSLMKLLVDPYNSMFTAKSGIWAPECLSWWLTRVENGGSIATLGPTGLGYGMMGGYCTSGAGGWMWPEFFRQYSEEGKDILGEAWTQTLVNYIDEFGPTLDMTDTKTVEEMVLLGDPTLKIGGYSSAADVKAVSMPKGDDSNDNTLNMKTMSGPVLKSKTSFLSSDVYAGTTAYQVTTNPLIDRTPSTFASDGNSAFIVGYARQEQTHSGPVYQDGFAVSDGGVLWKQLLMRNGNDEIVHQYVSYSGTGKYAVGTHYFGIGSIHDIILMNDMTNENTWNILSYYIPSGDIYDFGRNACAVGADYFHGGLQYIACFTADTTPEYDSLVQVPVFTGSSSNWISWFPGLENTQDVQMAPDHTTHNVLLTLMHSSGCYLGYVKHPDTWGDPLDAELNGPYAYTNPDLAVANGVGVVACESNGMVITLTTTNGGVNWGHLAVVSVDGEKPEIVGNPDGSFDCYFMKNGNIYVAHSEDGVDWDEPTQVSGVTNLATDDIFDAAPGGIVWPTTDGDIYAKIFVPTSSLTIASIDTSSDNKNVVATVINSGSTDQSNVAWEIKVEGDNPLYALFGLDITKGRVWKGGSTTGTIASLASAESTQITSGKLFGIGNVKVTVTAGDATATEDGFLFGSKILLHHPEE